MEELTEALQRISDGPHISVVDVQEHRSTIAHNKQAPSLQTFIVFDVSARLIVDSFVLEPSAKLGKHQRASLQIKNVSDRIFIVEKLDHVVGTVTKKVHLAIWQVLRAAQRTADEATTLKFELLTHFESVKGCKPILQDVNDRFFMVIVPFDRTWIYDYRNSNLQTIDRKLAPVFRPVLQHVDHRQEFKSLVINEDKLYIFMTSKRPNIDNKGGQWNPKLNNNGVDTHRIIIRNSQIYQLDVAFLATCDFFNPGHPQFFSNQRNQFILLNLGLDVRPKVLQAISVVPISRLKAEHKDMILIFGGDQNPSRFTYLFNDIKREVAKTDIYTGDQDRLLSNQLARDPSSSETVVFGSGRIHIFNHRQRKFTGASCYDWETIELRQGNRQSRKSSQVCSKIGEAEQLINPESDDEFEQRKQMDQSA